MAEDTDSALQSWLDGQEGMRLYQADTRLAVKCDYCSGAIHPNTITTHYISDRDLAGYKEGNLYPQRLYCEVCDRRQIRFPCRDVLELLVEHRVTDDHRAVEWKLRDASAPSQGVSWEPDAVVEHILPQENTSFTILDEAGATVGPEEIIDQLIALALDPRNVIADDGSVRTDRETRTYVEQTINERASELQGLTERERTQLLRNE